MMIKALFLLAALAITQAAGILAPTVYGSPYGYGGWNPYSSYPAQPALASQSSNIIRSPYNLGQISTYSKAIDTPFSSVRKSDIRVSNPGVAVSPLVSHYGYGAPVVSHYGAAPLVSHVASPVVSHYGVAPVAKVAHPAGLLGVAYSAAPAVSHMTYSNGLGIAYAW